MRIKKVGFGFQHTGNFSINRPRGSGDYLLLILKTDAIFHLESGKTLVESGSFILFKLGSPQIYEIAGDIFINDWIHFDADENDLLWLQSLDIPMDLPLPLSDAAALSAYVQNIFSERYSANPLRDNSSELWLRLLFTKLAEQLRQQEAPELAAYHKKLTNLRTRIYASPAHPWSVEEMAKELTVSKSYFQHLYKRVYHTGPIADVINSRIEQGKYLLFTTSFSVSHIAELCGYRSDVHFMRQFKSLAGVSPSDYRRQAILSSEEAAEVLHRNRNHP